MNNQKVPMIILSECVVFPGSSVYLNLYDSRSENAVSQAIGPGWKTGWSHKDAGRNGRR